jgi:hypothetical protein
VPYIPKDVQPMVIIKAGEKASYNLIDDNFGVQHLIRFPLGEIT